MCCFRNSFTPLSLLIFGTCLRKLLYRQGFLPLIFLCRSGYIPESTGIFIYWFKKTHFLENFCRDKAEEGLLCFLHCPSPVSFFPYLFIVCLVNTPTLYNFMVLPNEFKFPSTDAKTLANNNNFCLLTAYWVPAIAVIAFLVFFNLIKITACLPLCR